VTSSGLPSLKAERTRLLGISGAHTARPLKDAVIFDADDDKTRPRLRAESGRSSLIREQAESAGGYREVLRISLPLILSTTSVTVMLFVDRLFLSWYSQAAVAAAVPGGITYFTLCSFFFGTAQYVNTIVAQYHGLGDKPACARAVWQGVFFSVCSLPLILALIPLGWRIFAWSNHGPDLMSLERDFFSLLMMGGLALPFNGAFSSFFSGRGKSSIVMWGNLIGNAVNVLLDYVLIFGKWGFPELGIHGAGLATAFSQFIPAVFWAALFLSKRYQPTYRSRAQFTWDTRLFAMLVRYGAPAGGQLCLDVASFTLFVLLVGRAGEQDLAATNIVLTINMLSYLPMVGMSIATATLVGDYIGRGKVPAAEKSALSALKLALGYSAVFSAVYLLLPETLLGLFSPATHTEPNFSEIIEKGVVLLRFVALYSLFDTVLTIMSGALKGSGDTWFIMVTQTALAWIVMVAPVYLITENLHRGAILPWMFLVAYVMATAISFWLRFRSGHWKTIRMVDAPRPAA
jgi:multidrug resistance protein, MATE family